MRTRIKTRATMGAGILTALCLVSLSKSADAYLHRETEAGKKILWRSGEVEVILDESLELLGPMHEIEAKLASAFEIWSENADLPMDFVFVRGHCDEPGYRQGEANQSCIMAAHDVLDKGGDVGATTLVTHTAQSAEIIDSDIVFNLDALTSQDPGQGAGSNNARLDFDSVVLHEVGHFIGLAHSDVIDATMYPTLGLKETKKRSLHRDDIDGAVDLYAGLSFDIDPASCDGRSVAASGTPSGWYLFLATIVAVWAVRRRRRFTDLRLDVEASERR